MSRRASFLLVLLILTCLAVIVFSSYPAERFPFEFMRLRPLGLPRDFGPWPLDRVGPFGRHVPGLHGIVSALASYCFLYLASVLALFAFPRQLRVARDALGRGFREGLRFLGAGVLTALAIIALTALGAFAFVSFPVSLLLLSALLLAFWAGMVALSLALGRNVNRWLGLAKSSPILDLAIGTLVVFTLGRIPIAGWVVVALLGAVSLGVVVATRFGTGRPWSLAEFRASEEISHE